LGVLKSLSGGSQVTRQGFGGNIDKQAFGLEVHDNGVIEGVAIVLLCVGWFRGASGLPGDAATWEGKGRARSFEDGAPPF
jgi:hypothetical protein